MLHIDSSPRRDALSRKLSGEFADAWRLARPDGRVVRRDLGLEPLPHLDEAALGLLYGGVDGASPPASVHRVHAVIDEVRSADTLLIAAPMHNFTVPSALKAWIDHIAWPGLTVDPATGAGLLSDTNAVVILTRGGGYGPGSPREDHNFQDTWLSKALALVGITEVEFIIAELTLMSAPPAPLELQEMAGRSLAEAEARIRELARTSGRAAAGWVRGS